MQPCKVVNCNADAVELDYCEPCLRHYKREMRKMGLAPDGTLARRLTEEQKARIRQSANAKFHADEGFREKAYKACNKYRNRRYNEDPEYRERVKRQQKASRMRKKGLIPAAA